MAAREGQGLQIAVIIFALLAIVGLGGAYAVYASGESTRKELAAAKAAKVQDTATINDLKYELEACKYMLGLGSATQQSMLAAEGQATNKSPEIGQAVAKFESDMKAIEGYKGDTVPSYSTMHTILLAALNKKNANIVDANDQTSKVQSDLVAVTAREKERADAEQKAAETAKTELATEKTNFATSVKSMQDQIATVKTEVDKNSKEMADKVESLEKQNADYVAQSTVDKRTIDDLKGQRKSMESAGTLLNTLRVRNLIPAELENAQASQFESPDGKIVYVNQRQRLAWINLGASDGLTRQMTFSVLDGRTNGVSGGTVKARIEVVRVKDDHSAECRILDDSAGDPIIPGDIITTPTWSPGQFVHFAMAGIMDLHPEDNVKRDDYNLVRDLIKLNRGVIDAELTPEGKRVGNLNVSTRYLVLGEPPDETATKTALDEYTALQKEADRFGIEKITVQQLLTQMGWKGEQRTVELRGGASTQFRTRRPGQPAQPAAPASRAAEPAASPAAEPPAAADPFSAPADGAAPAADPFAPPAAAEPAAPAAADPFAPQN
jgi:hypothetical protein